MERDYDVIRDHVSRVVPASPTTTRASANRAASTSPRPRDERKFPTATGKANLTVNDLEVLRVPEGRLLLQTVRSHDQYNTTIYGLDDRYRGVKAGRRVVFVNPADLSGLGIADGAMVDLVSEWSDGTERRAPGFRVISYPTAPAAPRPTSRKRTSSSPGQHRQSEQHPNVQIRDHPPRTRLTGPCRARVAGRAGAGLGSGHD